MSILDDALAVLLADDLAHVVELALCARDGAIEAHARDGSVRFSADGTIVASRGRDPLASVDPAHLSPLADELANQHPAPAANAYPFAHSNVAHLFSDPRAPDIAVVHTGAHNWEERGGHRGEHGSLGVVQSRAPLILSGAGVAQHGLVPGAARMIDVAPTMAALLGIAPSGDGTHLRAQDGRVLSEALAAGPLPERVVVFLWDGTNANVLYAMAAAGELPAVARLIGSGTAFEHGLIASFPSVTLANHTTALTGVHPGRHGILHNFYFDRATGRQVVTNAPEVWHLAVDELRPDVETIFEAVARAGGGSTAAINEPTDRGATYKTFDALRTGAVDGVASAITDADDVPGATPAFVKADARYGWSCSADHLALQQALDVGAGADGNPVPRLMWVNLILPDTANHLGGPYSPMGHAGLKETDARMGQMLDAFDGPGTAFILLADHGMEDSDPDCTGDWKPGLARAGIPFRDEGEGFLYLGVDGGRR